MSFVLPEAAIEKHVAILGKTGSGKTTAAKSAIEPIVARGDRACILDPTGVWWGLRLGPGGKLPSGLDVVIFGGRHADLPLSADSGERLAEIVGTSSTSAIFDTSLLKVGERTQFFTDFATALLRENRGTLHVVVDEAHLFAPQGRVADPQSANMVHAANNLVSLGRSRGLRITLISQRAAKLHKDSLTQVETLIAMRLIAPQDRKAVEEWIAGQADKATGAELVGSLSTLDTGEGWVWSPEIELLRRVRFPAIATFDSSRPGAEQLAGELRPIDLQALRAQLEMPAATITADPAASPKTKAALRALAKSGADHLKAIEAAERRGYTRGKIEGYAAAVGDIGHLLDEIAIASEQLRAQLDRLDADVGRCRGWRDRAARPSEIPASPAATARPPKPARAKPVAEAVAAGAVTPALQRLLDVTAWFAAIGIEPAARKQVAALAGIKPTGSRLRAQMGELIGAGLLELAGSGFVRLTDAGRARAERPDIPAGPRAIVDAARGQLSPATARIFDLIVARHPESIERQAIASALGLDPAGSRLRAQIGEMTALAFVELAGTGRVRAADWLFLRRKGRRK